MNIRRLGAHRIEKSFLVALLGQVCSSDLIRVGRKTPGKPSSADGLKGIVGTHRGVDGLVVIRLKASSASFQPEACGRKQSFQFPCNPTAFPAGEGYESLLSEASNARLSAHYLTVEIRVRKCFTKRLPCIPGKTTASHGEVCQFLPEAIRRLKGSDAQFSMYCSRSARTNGSPPLLSDFTYPSRIVSQESFTLMLSCSTSATIFALAANRTKSLV